MTPAKVTSGLAIEWDSGSITRTAEGWSVRTDDSTVTLPTLAAALASIEDTMSEPHAASDVCFHLSMPQIFDAADEASITELFAYEDGGFVKVAGYWLPAEGVPGYSDQDPDSAFEGLSEYGEHGVTVGLYRYGETMICSWSGPEGEDTGFEVFGNIPVDEARARAEQRAEDIMNEWGINFDPAAGLRTVDVEVALPADSVLIQHRSTLWTYGAEYVAELDIYRRPDDSIAVTYGGDQAVIGSYASMAELDAHWNLEPGLEASIDDIEPDE